MQQKHVTVVNDVDAKERSSNEKKRLKNSFKFLKFILIFNFFLNDDPDFQLYLTRFMAIARAVELERGNEERLAWRYA